MSLDREIAAIAAEQHGLFTLRQVKSAGGNRNDASRRIKSGRWERPYEEVYRMAGYPWTYEARVLAPILAAGDGACASYKCACRLLGIGFKFAEPEISIPRGTFFRPKGVIVHTSTDLDRCEMAERGGIHLRPEVRRRDEARDHELRVVYGWTVERIWYEIPVFDPRLFVERVRQTFAEARARRS